MSLEPPLQTYWDWRAAGNFIAGGTGTGLLLVSAAAALLGVGGSLPAWLALLSVAAGLSLVWLEIGRPLRFLHVWFNPHTSWMTREAMLAPPLFAAGIPALIFDWPPLLGVAALIGMAFLYCQGRILYAAKGVPSWRSPRTVGLIVTTGLCEGVALFVVLAALRSPGFAPLTAGVALLLALLGVRAWVWRNYLEKLDAPRATLAVLARFNACFLLLGHALAGAFALLALLWPAQTRVAGILAGLCALLAGWALKFVLVTRAAHLQGYALDRSPARGAGSAGPGVRPGWD